MYVFLASDTRVLLGPYPKDSISGYAQGVRWCREVLGVTDIYRITADTRQAAQAKL